MGPRCTGWPVRVSRLDSRGRPQRAITRPTVEAHARRRSIRLRGDGPGPSSGGRTSTRRAGARRALPLPTGGEHIALDPNAEPAVGEGEVRVAIPRFSLAHSAKYLIFSTRRFELPPDGPATFAVDGRKVYEADTFIPERAQIGFGIWTMLPDRDGRSRSLDGQGLTARWRRFRVRGVDA
jgi:hypothetical protein